MSKERKAELRDIAKGMLPDPLITIGYMEHQIDLMAKVIEDLSGLIDKTAMTTIQKDRLAYLTEILKYASIDFANLTDPMQSYKVPNTTKLKADTRNIQLRYLKKQQEEGLL